MRGLTDRVGAVLDRHLAPHSPSPLCVALSGGGDSLALLILTLDWARRHNRRVLALVFDHGLHPDSGAWTAVALAAARRLGAQARSLVWSGDKPSTGLPSAARAARHSALADATRETGASVLLMGHTADDRLEAAQMRSEGSSVPDPKAWAPSPAWPQGRGVFLLRPLLDVRRAALRDLLRARSEIWLEDPANGNPRFARARARTALGADAPDPPPAEVSPAVDVRGWSETCGALETEGPVEAAALAAACLCAGGTDRPPTAAQLLRLMTLAGHAEDFSATLAGARVARRSGRLSVTRETGRLPIESVALPPQGCVVWDGRFDLRGERPGLTVRALGGLASRLPKEQREALSKVPVAARPSLPVLVDDRGNASCPVLAEGEAGTSAASLVMARFAAACGRIAVEMS